MERSWYWRLSMVVGLILLAVYYAAPSVLYFFAAPDVRRSETALEQLIPDWMPEARLNLGIDLQGGLHLVMGVDTTKAVLDRADNVCDELSDGMEEKGKSLARCRRNEEAPVLAIEMNSANDWPELRELLEGREVWSILSRSGTSVAFGMTEEYEAKFRDDTVEQALRTLRNRIDKYGVKEPELRRVGDSIMIQIPGVTAEDYEKIKEEIIGKTAQLEFKLVDSETEFFKELNAKADKPEAVTLGSDSYAGPNEALVTSTFLQSTDKRALKAFLDKYPPPDDRVVGLQEFKAEEGAASTYRTWLLERRTPLTGDALTDAYEYFDSEEGGYNVNMRFDRKGAIAFEKLTGENVKRRMAIVLDDVVDSAPVIQSKISGGSARITLSSYGSQQEQLEQAKALAIVLKAGALPAPVYPQEERTVGATLGDDAVVKGKNALAVAVVLVFLVMIVYYRFTGVVGTVALSINMLFLFAALSAFGATLTLPGIAGLALTIGMAVDANIIQFERIREEMAVGKTARAAVDAGFEKAFSAIFDANVTTFIAAIILQGTGSGPIKGFATTLMLGVVINTFTAVVVPRLILDYFTRGRRVQELSI